jgi:hypothetical protein
LRLQRGHPASFRLLPSLRWLGLLLFFN